MYRSYLIDDKGLVVHTCNFTYSLSDAVAQARVWLQWYSELDESKIRVQVFNSDRIQDLQVFNSVDEDERY